MITLQNHRLQVDLLRPGSQIYNGSRFDWTGFVIQVTLDGAHTFCGPESSVPDEGTGGIGLCSEFRGEEAIGFDDALPGDQFLKLGVGLLTRPDENPYTFFEEYELTPFPVTVAQDQNRIVFVQAPLPCRGYAARFTKTVSLEENCLLIHCRLDNVGERNLRTREYNHNFVSINRRCFGSGYKLTLPFDPHPEDCDGPYLCVGREITWPEPVLEAYFSPMERFAGAGPGAWELHHAESGVRLREETDFPWRSFALFGTHSVVCPEAFIEIDLAPADTLEWTRKYEFCADAKFQNGSGPRKTANHV